MSETVTNFARHDFTHLRIACRHANCHAVLELGLDLVEEAMKKTNSCCPVCGKSFLHPQVEGCAVTQLARALLGLHKMQNQVDVELPVRAEKARP